MKRKIIACLTALILVTAAGSFAEAQPTTNMGAFGVQLGINPIGGLPGSNVMFSFKVPTFPLIMGLGFAMGSNAFNFGFTGDYRAISNNIYTWKSIAVNYYMGPGFYLGYSDNMLIGARFPIGIDVYPIKNLEAFLEVAPTLAVKFGNEVKFPVFGLQAELGARFWF
jgi:hypothetical protein